MDDNELEDKDLTTDIKKVSPVSFVLHSHLSFAQKIHYFCQNKKITCILTRPPQYYM